MRLDVLWVVKPICSCRYDEWVKADRIIWPVDKAGNKRRQKRKVKVRVCHAMAGRSGAGGKALKVTTAPCRARRRQKRGRRRSYPNRGPSEGALRSGPRPPACHAVLAAASPKHPAAMAAPVGKPPARTASPMAKVRGHAGAPACVSHCSMAFTVFVCGVFLIKC